MPGASAENIAALRLTVAKLEQASPGAAAPAYLPLGLREEHANPLASGLFRSALNEIVAASYRDQAAAIGFAAAVMVRALASGCGPAVLVTSRYGFADWGRLYGQGLRRLGLDVGRLILVSARDDRDALWAIEEVCRAKAGVAVVAGTLAGDPDLTQSRRLNLAAAGCGAPLLLLRRPRGVAATAAATRWRISTAAAARDRFGSLAHSRWQVDLERSRYGRTGRWLLEWNHVAHRFDLATVVADRPLLRQPVTVGEEGGRRLTS